MIGLLFTTITMASEPKTKGDVSKSKVKDYKQFFEDCDQVLTDTFTICYSHKRKLPTAVYVEITGEQVVKDIEKRPPFYTDKRVKKGFRTYSKDYTKSGYDRGHFGASDASHDWDLKHQKATYSMANIVPQTPRANRYKFVALEKYERLMAVKHGRLQVLTLAYWNARPKTLGKNKLHVPSAFAKIFTCTTHDYRECFFIWNTEKYDKGNGQNPNKYKVPCDKIIKMYGTDVGEVSSWSMEDSKNLKALLKRFKETPEGRGKHNETMIKHLLMVIQGNH